ncbi:MAG: 2-hydroxychromene-2-carboxylate isomerase [Burkholderiaceae bacterium]
MPTSTNALEFYFDFSSPYAYIASEEIEAVATRLDRPVQWHPILLGAVFKETGGAPLTELHPAKAAHSIRDFARSAAFAGVPYRHPSPFPIGTVTAARAVLWMQRTRPRDAAPFIHAVFRDFFINGRNISDAAVIGLIGAGFGVDPSELAVGVKDESIKAALKDEIDTAMTRGVFGVPTVFVDGEMFWGHDRLPQVERWASQGPF